MKRSAKILFFYENRVENPQFLRSTRKKVVTLHRFSEASGERDTVYASLEPINNNKHLKRKWI